MKVNLVPAPGAKLLIVTKDGKKLDNDDIKTLSIEPFFSASKGFAEVVRGTAVNVHEEQVDKFTIVAAGATGKITRREQKEKSAVPSIDAPKAKPTDAKTE